MSVVVTNCAVICGGSFAVPGAQVCAGPPEHVAGGAAGGVLFLQTASVKVSPTLGSVNGSVNVTACPAFTGSGVSATMPASGATGAGEFTVTVVVACAIP